ncbi:MAG: Ig-like domain-containing protein, partial [Calditrichia bacterium]
DSLEKNQTYIFNIGTGVKDLRGNTLPQPVVVPFSTGPQIDHGTISGTLYGAKKTEGMLIYAYEISDTFTVQSVFKYPPRYYTQVGKEGKFTLPYLRPARYRVFVLEDNNLDRTYTLQTDRIGIPVKDIVLDSINSQFPGLSFRLIKEDTAGAELVRVDTLHRQLFVIGFSELLDQAQGFHITILDSQSRKPLPAIATVLNTEEPGRLWVFTKPQQPVLYQGRIAAVRDTAGNVSDSNGIEFRFFGASHPDTAKPRLIKIIPDSSEKDVRYDAHIKLQFTHPVDSASLAESFSLTGEDRVPVKGHWKFSSLMNPEFLPDTLLPFGAALDLKIDLKILKTIFGRAFGDSIFESSFHTVDYAELGEIAGKVTAADTFYKKAIITAIEESGRGAYRTTTEPGKPYLLTFLPDGRYRMQCGIDINQNGVIDRGSTIPFKFAEPFIVLPDTVKVRKRWTTEGINIRF